MKRWEFWEAETRTFEYKFSNGKLPIYNLVLPFTSHNYCELGFISNLDLPFTSRNNCEGVHMLYFYPFHTTVHMAFQFSFSNNVVLI